MADLVKIEYFRVPPRWLFVRLETADGTVGWGEATLEGHTEAVEGALEHFAGRLIGRDSRSIEDIWQTCYRGGFYRGGPVLMSALSGIDIALWDLKGKRLGVPVWDLLGGKVREKIKVYAWIGGDRPSDVETAAKARLAQKFSAVKMNATEDLNWLDSPASLEATIERAKIVKSLGMDVGIDFHGRVHRPMAKQLAAALEPLHPMFIEEPLLSDHPVELARLAQQTSIPIALGERLYTRWDFRPMLESGAVDIIQPDVAHCGGISELKRIAAMAEAYDVALAPHSPLGPIALAACLQIGACCPNHVIQEMSLNIHYNVGGYDLLTYVVNKEVFEVKDKGWVDVPIGPGIGVEIDEDMVLKIASEKPAAWRSVIWRGENGELREW